MRRLLALILGLVASPLWADGYPALHDVTGVAAGDVLNIRERPDAAAPVIGTLAPDAKGIEVIAATDGWAVVNTEDRTGYADLRYLSVVAGPAWNLLEQPLICLGTEPFWSLDIDPTARQARYAMPEDMTPKVAPITEIWPGQPWTPTAAVALPEGLVVLVPADCSDGMSERGYGISVDIFLQAGTDRQRLSGCCTLAQP